MTDPKVLDELERMEKAARAWPLDPTIDARFKTALRVDARQLIADARRLQRIEAAAEYYLDATMELPPGCMAVERAQRELRKALEDCWAGAVERSSPSTEDK